MLDQYKREITYLRISLTNRCNFNCDYCKPDGRYCPQETNQKLTLEELLRLIRLFNELGITKVRLTGGEPLLYPELETLVTRIRQETTIDEVTMTTNGFLLEEKAFRLKEAGLTRVNVSMDSLQAHKFKKLTKVDGLEQVKRGIREAIRVGLVPIRLNVVLMRGVNDDEVRDFILKTLEEPIDIRFIELMPIGQGNKMQNNRYMSAEEALAMAPELEKLSTSKESVATYYRLRQGLGRIGVIPSVSQHFCGRCNRIRINAYGQLKYCLLNDKKADLTYFMRANLDDETIKEKLVALMQFKPKGHEGRAYSGGNMYEIGG